MATVQLLGRGLYGPDVVFGPDVSPLWQFFLSPSRQNSVIVYKDGSVVERATFLNSDILSDDVYVWIYGGTDFRCEVGSFEYDALTAAGYTWNVIPDRDTYPIDYTSEYP